MENKFIILENAQKCGSTNLIHSGKGIERIEEELKKYFDVPMIKVDSELSRNKDYFQEYIKISLIKNTVS